MRGILKAFAESQAIVAKMIPTRCGEISFKMRKGVSDIIETLDSYYTIDGAQAIVVDKRDGQEYIIEVKPFKRTDNEREAVVESERS